MSLLKAWTLVVAIFFSFNSKAQHFELLGSTEQQIRDKLTKDYPIVNEDSVDHGLTPVLMFENEDHTSKVSAYFYPKRDGCYMIQTWAPVRFMDAYINIADRRYKKVGNNTWKFNDVSIRIIRVGDQVLSTFTKLPAGKEI